MAMRKPPKDSPLDKAIRNYETRKAMVGWAENIPFDHPRKIAELEEKIAIMQRDLARYRMQVRTQEEILSENRKLFIEAEKQLELAKAGTGIFMTEKSKLLYRREVILRQLARLAEYDLDDVQS